MRDTLQETRDAVIKIQAKFEGGTAVAGVAMKGGKILLTMMFAVASILGGLVVQLVLHVIGG